jgi:hypothetical protein
MIILDGDLSILEEFDGEISIIECLDGDLELTEELDGEVGIYLDIASEYPVYKEGYEVIPHVDSQVLNTAQKLMTDNVTVREIPYFETSNPDGTTVYIASTI